VSIGATGGLRPPLLYWCADVCRRNNDFCDAQTYIRPGAAGVSPPWFAEPNAVRLQPRYVRRRPDRRPRAAGVSPPWLSNPPAHATVFCRRGTFAYHGWLTPAAPGCTTLVCCETRDSQSGVVHDRERRVSARRAEEASWRFAKTSLQQVSALATRLRKGTHARW